MAKKKVTFGDRANCEVRYVIAIVFTDNTIKYVTNVQVVPHKYCEWKDGEKAKIFTDKVTAENICFGLNIHGTGAFVMEVPDYFNDDDFSNPTKE